MCVCVFLSNIMASGGLFTMKEAVPNTQETMCPYIWTSEALQRVLRKSGNLHVLLRARGHHLGASTPTERILHSCTHGRHVLLQTDGGSHAGAGLTCGHLAPGSD